MAKADEIREGLIQDRSAQILDEVWPRVGGITFNRSMKSGEARVSTDTLLIAKLLARSCALQEKILEELRGIHGHVGLM